MKQLYHIIIPVFLLVTSSHAQVLEKISKVKDKITSVTIDKLSKEPITTSFSDVDKTRYLEDSFGNDQTFESLFDQQYIEGEGFQLQPGFYEGTFQSFCIKVGTVMPGRGNGRFYAPLKGPKADIIETIILAYEQDDQLTQQDIQLLLWAIIAKTDFHKMKGPVKLTALKLLSKGQIARLSKGSLDALTRRQLGRLAYKSETMRNILLAENTMRGKYYQGYGDYKEFEDIAMVAGVEPIIQGFDRGRWTKHPDGFFTRHYAGGYPETRTQIYIPEPMGRSSYNPTNGVAVPAGYGQRLLQTSLPTIDGGPNTGGNPGGDTTTGGPGTDDDGSDDGTDDSDNSDDTVVLKPAEDPFCVPMTNLLADKAIKTQMIMQNIPGLAVAVFQNGQMIHLKAYGYEDVFAKKPIKLNTKVNWASISKSVTGVAAAQLDQSSPNYNINDRVTKYIDNWKNVRYMDVDNTKGGVDGRPELIEIRHLLTNTGGVQQYRKGRAKTNFTVLNGKSIEFIEKFENYDSPLGVFDATKAVSVFNESVLDFRPGMGYLYSSYGFVLAGATIDKASPNGYVDWVEKNIAHKAGLRSFQVRDKTRPGHTMRKDGILKVGGTGNAEYTLPAGGWESNICDLAKYARGLSTGLFLEKKKDLLWVNSIAVSLPGAGNKYSYGLNFAGSGATREVWHGGHGGNSRSYMHFFPDNHTGIVILAPTVYSNLPHLALQIYKALNIKTRNTVVDHTPLDTCIKGMNSGTHRFFGVWRKTNEDVLIRTGLQGDTFFEELDRLKASGYQCVDIEPFVQDETVYWDGIFKKGVAAPRILRDLSQTDFRSSYSTWNSEGWTLIDLEIYTDANNKKKYSGLFRRNGGSGELVFDTSSENLKQMNTQHGNNGFKLVDIEVAPKGNGNSPTLSGVWAVGDASLVDTNLTQPQFKRLLGERRDAGYRVLDLEFYWIDSENLRIAAVWEKSTDDELLTGDGLGVQLYCGHMDTHENNSKNDYELIDWGRMTGTQD